MKTLVLLSFLLAGCATKQLPVTRMTSVLGTSLPSSGVERVRYAENIKTYPVGRYIDPHNSRIMHEGHTLYRVEATAKWNLHPNGQGSIPPRATNNRPQDSAKTSSPLSDELTIELNRQREATKTVIQHGQIVSQKLGELSDAVGRTKEIAENNKQLLHELDATKQRLDILEGRLTKQTAPQVKEPNTIPSDEKSAW